MTKSMLIDASHPEETRVAVVDGNRIEELDFEIASKKQLRGNIYLAKVTRVEPSLQAAFIEYGGNRHGFLAFNEIHPDYFQIPHADREALMREAAEDHGEEPLGEGDEPVETSGHDDDDDKMEAELERRRRRLMRKYKIQEVIRRRQIMLVQVVKEERGNKGAALTTYLSLAGRYCVLMPNTARGGGISRKIESASDRKRLKSAASSLDVPQGMGLIIRTAGAARTKAEIKRDYDYLLRMWESIRETTLKSIAPSLIYAEEDLVKRAVRDMFDKEFDSIQVEGEEGWREARDFMRMIMPSQSKKVVHYADPTPLFVKYRIEDQLAQIHSPVVPLKSGGYLVINQTEALVAIDVNSGRATRERNIEQTAFKTNCEAAEESARQLRLRDLAGLIVIDFIDMDEGRNNRSVEKVLKDCLREDRARVQMGKISGFGLMEISRQRRRLGVLEGATEVCHTCHGAGRVRSVESSAVAALRALETEAAKGGAGEVSLKLCTAVGLYVLNEKRAYLARLAQTRGLHVVVSLDEALPPGEQEIVRLSTREGPLPEIAPMRPAVARIEMAPEADFDEVEDLPEEEDEAEEEAPAARAEPAPRRERDEAEEGEESRRGRGRRRRRRGGRGRDEREPAAPGEVRAAPEATNDAAAPREEDDEDDGEAGTGAASASGEHGEAGDLGERGRRRRRRGRRGGRRVREEDGAATAADPYGWTTAAQDADDAGDPYSWRDPLAAEAPAPRPVEAPRAEAAAEVEAEAQAVEIAPSESTLTAEDAGEPEAGPQVAAAPGTEPYGWSEEAGAAPPAAEAKPKPRRARRPRKGEAAVEAVTDAPAEFAAEEGFVAPEPEAPPPAEPEPATVAAANDVAPSAPAAAAEPDPAEISAPPPEPKRGWWRRVIR